MGMSLSLVRLARTAPSLVRLLIAVTTSSVTACSSSTSDDSGPDASNDADRDSGGDGGDSGVCAPAHNDPACPATYSNTFVLQPCSPIGVSCLYPGFGDGQGCSPAELLCTGDGDAGDGGDAASGTWTVGQ